MTAVWPASLPIFRQIGTLVEDLDDKATARHEPSGSVAIGRQRSIIEIGMVSFDVGLTSDQVDVLIAFYREDLASGSLPFTMIHPRTGGAETFVFVDRPDISDVSVDWFRAALPLRKIPSGES